VKIAISGASGFIGSHVKKQFGNYVVIDKDDTEEEIYSKLQGVEVVINLAGASIMQRWDDEYKEILYNSRIDTTKKLVLAINKSQVSHFISTSAIGIYPDLKVCDESCKEVSKDFLGMLCQDWEKEANKCNKTTTILRLGVVLGKDGGAFSSMLSSFKLCLGGIIGDGRMMTSWIDIDDLMNIYKYIIDKNLDGTFNAVSPNPVTNLVFTKTFGRMIRRPTLLPLPFMVVKMLFAEGAIVLTSSKEVYPKALQKNGFKFMYPDISSCFMHLLSLHRPNTQSLCL